MIIRDDYGVNADEIWMRYFGNGGKARQRSPPDNLTRWIIALSKCLTRKDMTKASRFVQAYNYLVFTFQVQARSSIVGNSTSAVDAQQVFKDMFKSLMNEDYSVSVDIDRYHSVSEHAISKVDFLVGTGIYILSSNLNLSMRKVARHNTKTSISSTDMKIGSNGKMNKAKTNFRSPVNSEGHLVKSPDDKSMKDHPAVHYKHTKTILPVDNQK